ncbi:hypothetical protein CY652_14095 [Burkholderia sp. WAC0059]|uniref:ester cyclase n=1 Tax=Burkholderia sp. WAC0059 TaxID=2066022 RepID=UPI000C7ECB2C|nr:ester cyclase [Burkholderia sp. WAC0059]PLZ01797.1 hypothetical protein CY652_14095 [Burkholderia sp. WAC0059]
MDRRHWIATGLKASALAAALPLPAASVFAQEGPDVATRFAATLSAHDLDAFAALFSPDYVNHQFSAASRPPAGMTAKTATVSLFRARLAGMPDLTVTVEKSLVTTDGCAASFIYEGTHTAPYMGVAPTGRHLRFSSCDIFRVDDGRIVEHWGMGDIAGLMAQLKG